MQKNHHPIHRGVEIISKDRTIYNLQTRFVKNILLVLVCCLEIIYFLCIGIYYIVLMLSRRQVQRSNIHLICPTIFTYYYYFPSLIVSLNSIWVLICVEQSILLILTRYLIARYQGYPYWRVVFNQIIVLLLFQSFIIAISSTIYTIPLSFLAIPIINIVNWINLKTYTGFLSSVLRSKLEEIKKYHWDRHFFEEQNDAYDWFKLFRVSLLVTYFFMNTLSVISSIISTLFYVSFASCLYSKKFNFKPFVNLPIQNIIDSICLYLGLISNDIISQLISISIGLPLWVLSLSMLAMPIIKRYRSRKQATRFNHSSEREFLIRNGLRDPTNYASV